MRRAIETIVVIAAGVAFGHYLFVRLDGWLP
jgi:hypothetical protein